MRIGCGFLALCRGLFALLFAGLRGILPQVAFKQRFFAFLDALALFLPEVERVQFVRCKHDLNVRGGGGLFVAVLVKDLARCSNRGDLFRGVVRGGDLVQRGRVETFSGGADDLFIRHGKYFLSCFVLWIVPAVCRGNGIGSLLRCGPSRYPAGFNLRFRRNRGNTARQSPCRR